MGHNAVVADTVVTTDKTGAWTARDTITVGAYSRLLKSLSSARILINLFSAAAVFGGYTLACKAATWQIILPLLAFLFPASLFAQALNSFSLPRLQRNLIAVLRNKASATAEQMDSLRLGIIHLPWQLASLNVAMWLVLIPVAIVILIKLGSIDKDFNIWLPAIQFLPIVFVTSLLAYHKACEPFRLSLLTGVDLRALRTKFVLTSRKRYILLLFTLVYAIGLLDTMLLYNCQTQPAAQFASELPYLIALFSGAGAILLAPSAYLALQPDQLEAEPDSNPDAVDVLAASYEIVGEIGRGFIELLRLQA